MENTNNLQPERESNGCLGVFIFFLIIMIVIVSTVTRCKEEEKEVAERRQQIELLKQSAPSVEVINVSTTCERVSDFSSGSDGVATYYSYDVITCDITYKTQKGDTLTHPMYYGGSTHPNEKDTIKIVVYEGQIHWWEKE